MNVQQFPWLECSLSLTELNYIKTLALITLKPSFFFSSSEGLQKTLQPKVYTFIVSNFYLIFLRSRPVLQYSDLVLQIIKREKPPSAQMIYVNQ